MRVLPANALYSIRYKTSDGTISYEAIDLSWEKFLEEVDKMNKAFPHDENIQSYLREYWNGKDYNHEVAFVGAYGCQFDAYVPTVKLEGTQTCPHRYSFGAYGYGKENEDKWEMRGEDKCCSYCGSIDADRVIEILEKYGPESIEYNCNKGKLWIRRPDVVNASFGGLKSYLIHWTSEQIARYNELRRKLLTA